MERVPVNTGVKGAEFTVGDFLKAARGKFPFELLAGEKGLSRSVLEPMTNRPGLALTGFYKLFAWRRLQLLGESEQAYITSLSHAKQLACLRALIAHKAYCFVFTNGFHPTADALALAEKSRAVVMSTTLKTRYFAHQCEFVLEALAAPKTSVYGTMVDVDGLGVLIEGNPGLGKSETALGLIKHGHALVADDLTCVRREIAGDALFASPSAATAGFMEIRGLGIVHIPSIFGINAVRGEKQLQLVITLRPLKDVRDSIDRVGQTQRVRDILGVRVPNVVVPVSEGRDLVNLVETAAQQYRLAHSGYDPVEVLSERLRQRAEARGDK